jgi:predicted ArsR family transcriptional regulator
MRGCSKRHANRERLVAVLRSLGPSTVEEIVKELEAAESTVRRHLRALEKEGLAVHDGASGARGDAVRWWATPTTTTENPKG